MTTATWNPESPSLRPSIVCYADILGFRNLTDQAFEAGKGEELLRQVKDSLANAYSEVRYAAKLHEALPSVFDMKFFTDNIVVAYPLSDPFHDYGEPELGNLMTLFAEVQASLSSDGFFLRGGITSGEHYQDDDIAFGRALLEAVDLEKSGKPPRLVIGRSVEKLIAAQLTFYGDKGWAWHHQALLEDPSDEHLFINYLNVAFGFFPEGPIFHGLLKAHRDHVLSGLNANASESSVLAKYEWLATYHNYVCSKFAARYSGPVNCDADSEEIAIKEEAQRVLKLLVSSENFTAKAPPRPLDAERLHKRLRE